MNGKPSRDSSCLKAPGGFADLENPLDGGCPGCLLPAPGAIRAGADRCQYESPSAKEVGGLWT